MPQAQDDVVGAAVKNTVQGMAKGVVSADVVSMQGVEVTITGVWQVPTAVTVSVTVTVTGELPPPAPLPEPGVGTTLVERTPDG
ncbi:hypothetical protein CHU98_g3557 [Xylaria longipes]|nr:hypothetical protein CHU98_g3557 [Xylaria longipes]